MSSLTIPTKLKAGGTLRVDFSTFDNTVDPPVLADPSTPPTIYIEYRDASGTITPKITAGAVAREAMGLYHYDFQSSPTDLLGTYWVWFESTFVSKTMRSTPLGAILMVL